MHASERSLDRCKFEYSMQKICDAGCWLEIAYDPASQPASQLLPPQLEATYAPSSEDKKELISE